MNKQWDAIWINGKIETCSSAGTLKNGAIAVKAGRIAWIGHLDKIPDCPIHDLEGRLVTPGFIDCHTHVIYAGNRANEFAMRLQGKSYADIARSGGGILATVKATREASKQELFQQSLNRIKVMLKSGLTTLEIKSGYGLDWQTELKMLQVAAQLQKSLPLTIYKTFLGAHTVPPEYVHNADDYIAMVCEIMLPEIAKNSLAQAVDVFCENIAFNLQQTEKVFATARSLGLAIKCHAEQLTASGAARLAADYHALSVDHLEYLQEQDIDYLANKKIVAVLLPGAFYFLREKRLPNIASLRAHHIPIAIATDCNPGTSPILSLLMIMNMACTLFGLTVQEALLGVTLHAAKSLGLQKDYGSLEVGKYADFAVWNVESPVDLCYLLGAEPLYKSFKNGEPVTI